MFSVSYILCSKVSVLHEINDTVVDSAVKFEFQKAFAKGFDPGMPPRFLTLLTASLKCLGWSGPLSPHCSMTSRAVIRTFCKWTPTHLAVFNSLLQHISHVPSSTTSPTKTLAMPAIAMTTFWDIEQPVMVCINCYPSITRRRKKKEEWYYESKP